MKGSELYNTLLSTRKKHDSIWKRCAELTLPFIFLDTDNESDQRIIAPENSVGSEAVNGLASKLLINLFPPTNLFFKLDISDDDLDGLSKEEIAKVETELSKIEQRILEIIEEQYLRTPLYEALKQLIVTGNSLVYKKDNIIKVFNPYNFCVERDYSGNVLIIAIRELISKEVLSQEIIEEIKKNNDGTGFDEKKDIEIYTIVKRIDENNYEIFQEIEGFQFNFDTVKLDDLPYMVLRFNSMPNSSYGIGLVEQYLGDFNRLEKLSTAVADGTMVMSKIIYGKKPNAKVDLEGLKNSKSGDVVIGDLDQISTLQTNKSFDFSVASQQIIALEQKIGKAFLSLDSSIRNSERTTATEVRANMLELESKLGGVFTILTQELQVPLLRKIIKSVNNDLLDTVKITITSGLNAISKAKDLEKLNTFIQQISIFGVENVAPLLDIKGYITEVANSLGIDASKVLKSEEQVQQEQQAQAEAQQAQAQQEIQQEINKKGQEIANQQQ